MLEYILFDLGGTLTDSAPGITNCVAYALEKFGIEVKDKNELKKFIGPPLLYSFKTFFGFSAEDAKRATEYYRERFSVVGLFENDLYDGISQMLKGLSEKGKKLFVATGKPEEYTHRILEHFGIDRYFTFVCGNTLREERPEKKDVIGYIKQRFPLNSSNSVMVGDRCYDIEGARLMGIPSIGVCYGFGTREELTASGADRIVETVQELKELLIKE